MLSTNLLDDGTVESGWTDSFHSHQSESRCRLTYITGRAVGPVQGPNLAKRFRMRGIDMVLGVRIPERRGSGITTCRGVPPKSCDLSVRYFVFLTAVSRTTSAP